MVAQTREQARRAARLAKVEVAVGTPLVTVDDALAAETRILPDYTFRKDDSAAALANSPSRVKGQLRIGGQEHFYLEGQVSLAIPGEDGDMLVHSSTQHPSECQHLIAQVLEAPGRAGHRRGAAHGRRVRRQGDARRRNGRRSRRSARASPGGRARSGSTATTT